MNKQIANIVFYKFWDPTREEPMQQACIFYADGTVKNVLYEEGQELANQIAKEEKIKTKAEFVKLVNTKRVYTMSGAEFERRFKEFLGKGTALVPVSNAKSIVVPSNGTTPVNNNTKAATNNNSTGTATATPKPTAASSFIVPPVIPVGTKTPMPTATKTPAPVGTKIITPIPVVTKTPVPTGTTPVPVGTKTPVPTATTPTPVATTPAATTTADKYASKNGKKKKKGKGLFKKLWVKVTAFVLAAAMFFTGGFFLGRHSKQGDIINNNITNVTQTQIPAQDQAFLNLLKKSTNEDQKAVMTHQSQSLDLFNRDFANLYLEEGKDVKAALTWDEMMALNLAYNTYTKDQIKIMFNGAEADATALSNAYRNGTLQLMGAYVISTRENPVNSAAFLTNPEEKAFVEKYSDLFYKMKETTGAEQVAAIDAFYAELHKDFPITDQVREEGISHADGREQVKAYKAAVVPMVSAAEIMFQNVSGTDHTLSDKAIKYFNDLGLCNVVDDNFQRIETITLSAETDESQPLYTEFRDAKITELIYEGNYPTDDAHRDLSQLAEFQKWVNGHFEIVDGQITGTIVPNPAPTTTTRTETTTTVTQDRNTAVSQAGEDAVKKAEAAVDAELEKQNQAAQQQAQEEADRNSQAAKDEVAKDNADMEEDVNNANNTINNGGTVNEDDFGDHNVDFDEEFEDGNGNLSDSVTDITTDGDGAKTENDLPDPNQTGAIFDGTATGTGTGTGTGSSDDTVVDNSGIYEYEEPYYGGMSNEEIVNAYIESLAGQGTAEAGKVYTK